MCRYCGSQLPEAPGTESASSGRRAELLGAGAVAVAAIALFVAYLSFRALPTTGHASSPIAVTAPAEASSAVAAQPSFPVIKVGETSVWKAESNFGPVTRQAGPYVLEITKREQDEMAAPVLKLTAGGQTVTLEGELASPGYENKITLLANRRGAAPIVMLQSFTGGAHCCNHVQLAGFSASKLKVIDVGSWDGDEMPVPTDISGDGTADFVMSDNSFLYAFASYAQSYAPPKILNVVAGKIIDVSRSPAFKPLFAKEIRKAGENCRPGLGLTANGACPSFVASAARLGKLNQAWSQMLGAYDASVDWQLPQGCWVSDENGCPSGQEITYKSYPEALRAFLVRQGYISKTWVPPEMRQTELRSSEIAPDQTT